MGEARQDSGAEIKQSLRRRDSWLRGAYILLFAVIYGVAEFVFWVVVLFQFGSLLFTGGPNLRVRAFSDSLCLFLYQVLQYMSLNTEERPYPFGEWPGDTAKDAAAVKAPVSKKKRATKHSSATDEGDN